MQVFTKQKKFGQRIGGDFTPSTFVERSEESKKVSALRKAGEVDKAIDEATKALEANKKDTSVLSELGWCLYTKAKEATSESDKVKYLKKAKELGIKNNTIFADCIARLEPKSERRDFLANLKDKYDLDYTDPKNQGKALEDVKKEVAKYFDIDEPRVHLYDKDILSFVTSKLARVSTPLWNEKDYLDFVKKIGLESLTRDDDEGFTSNQGHQIAAFSQRLMTRVGDAVFTALTSYDDKSDTWLNDEDRGYFMNFLDKYIGVFPNVAALRYHKGRILATMEDTEGAVDCLKEAYTLATSSENFVKNDSAQTLALLLAESNPNVAVGFMAQRFKANPDRVGVLRNLVKVLLAAGDYPTAKYFTDKIMRQAGKPINQRGDVFTPSKGRDEDREKDWIESDWYKTAGSVNEDITVDDADDEFSVLLRKYRKAMDSFLKGDIEVEAPVAPKTTTKKASKKSEAQEDFDDLKGGDDIPF